MTVLRRDRARQGRGQSFVLLAALLYRAACNQILKFFIRTQPKHFLSATCGVAGTEIFVHDVEELLELERRPARKHSDEFLRDEIRNPAGKCVFLENSHRGEIVTQICEFAAHFSLSEPTAARAEMTRFKESALDSTAVLEEMRKKWPQERSKGRRSYFSKPPCLSMPPPLPLRFVQS